VQIFLPRSVVTYSLRGFGLVDVSTCKYAPLLVCVPPRPGVVPTRTKMGSLPAFSPRIFPISSTSSAMALRTHCSHSLAQNQSQDWEGRQRKEGRKEEEEDCERFGQVAAFVAWRHTGQTYLPMTTADAMDKFAFVTGSRRFLRHTILLPTFLPLPVTCVPRTPFLPDAIFATPGLAHTPPRARRLPTMRRTRCAPVWFAGLCFNARASTALAALPPPATPHHLPYLLRHHYLHLDGANAIRHASPWAVARRHRLMLAGLLMLLCYVLAGEITSR